ncbi:MAG: hypothetical protein ABEI86_01835 [Halobacteriaceae archaeon]
MSTLIVLGGYAIAPKAVQHKRIIHTPSMNAMESATPIQDSTNSTRPTVDYVAPYEETRSDFKLSNSENKPIAVITIGSETNTSRSHSYRIWNGDVTTHQVHIRIVSGNGGIINRSYTLPPNRSIVIEIQEPGHYTTTITVFENQTVTSKLRVMADKPDFTCNSKSVTVAILKNGRTTTRVLSTLLVCEDANNRTS